MFSISIPIDIKLLKSFTIQSTCGPFCLCVPSAYLTMARCTQRTLVCKVVSWVCLTAAGFASLLAFPSLVL